MDQGCEKIDKVKEISDDPKCENWQSMGNVIQLKNIDLVKTRSSSLLPTEDLNTNWLI